MKIDQETLKEISVYAELAFSPGEVAVIVGVDRVKFLEQYGIVDSDIWLAFKSGSLKSQALIRISLLKLAKNGSGSAQTQALNLFKEMAVKATNETL